MDTLSSIEWACKELYTTNDPSARLQAEKTCTSIYERHDCMATCQSLLERADSCYSQFIAASSLTKFISNKDTVVHVNLRLQLRKLPVTIQPYFIVGNFALNYLATRPNLEPFVQQALIVLICRLTKIGWFDSVENGPDWPFRDIFESAKNFIQTDLTRAVFFLRKLSISFRDTLLFSIFQLGLDLLRQTDANLKTLTTTNSSQLQVVQHSLELVLSCLNYDFVGTSIGCGGDHSSGAGADDMATVQLPTAWRPVFLDVANIDLFFRLFAGLPQAASSPQLRPLTLSCLVQIASIRRTLFTNVERQTFLTPLVSGCLEVLRRRDSLLCDPSTYHEFCCLLSRMKATFQLSEFLQTPGYPEFIKLVTDFTTQCLYLEIARHLQNCSEESGFGSCNSLHYLLVLWQRLVASVPYVRTSEPYLIDTYAPQVARAFVESRLAGVPRCMESVSKIKSFRASKKAANANGAGKGTEPMSEEFDADEYSCPLDDVMTLTQQLDQFSIIGRCDYANTCELIVQLFDQSFNLLQSKLQQLVSTNPTALISTTVPVAIEQIRDIRLEENRLAWLVYMIGALIKGRSTSSSGGTVDADRLDGELVARVLRLLQFGDARLQLLLQLLQQNQQSTDVDVASLLFQLSSGATIRLELAIITFLERFRHIYVGENISRASKMYQSLSELVGISDEQTILQLFAAKILLNLRYWSNQEAVLEPTLNLLGELASSFSSMRKLLQLDDIKFMLANHTPANFRFLSVSTTPTSSSLSLSRYRTEFYAYLSRLMLVTLSGSGADDNRPFLDFLMPLTQVANTLISNLLLSESCPMSPEDARSSVIGLARDLAGVAFSLNTMASFKLFLDWFYPSLFTLFGRAMELWHFDPLVTCPVLKLLAEVVHNRNDRLKFEGTLPIGYLLLAEMTKILLGFGSQLTSFFGQVEKENLYSHKVKPLTRYLNALRITLSGKFANLAIFGLVGDDSFEKTVKMSTEMLMCVTEEELRSFTKLSKAYFALLECLTQNHMVLLSSLEPSIIRQFYSAIVIGVDSLDTSVAWSACSCLDYMLTHIYKLTSMPQDGINGVSLNHGNEYPLFVPNPPSGAPTSEIALAARHRLTALFAGQPNKRSRGCCSALAIWSDREEAGNANLRQNFLQPPAGFVTTLSEFTVTSRQLMVTFLATFMNEECKNQWSISRPLLALILLNQEYFSNLQSAVINAVNPHQRSDVEGLFRKLMEDVENNLFAKNRDKFTQNISAFRHAVVEFMKSSSTKPLGELTALTAFDSGDTFSLRSILLSAATSI
ncbi:unnamed protein product [Mesocestoides corti]|uniref:Exportin-7/Ran-binding protein 17 TPR repeats domain-containing protein n=1 Tax=Mesocestoides corti TaxID=53468 RepID=A0A158QTD6_MESCO|nr:unnamed protein product [Mesocestoides corti]